MSIDNVIGIMEKYFDYLEGKQTWDFEDIREFAVQMKELTSHGDDFNNMLENIVKAAEEKEKVNKDSIFGKYKLIFFCLNNELKKAFDDLEKNREYTPKYNKDNLDQVSKDIKGI